MRRIYTKVTSIRRIPSMKELDRYSLIKEKFPREFVLLQGKGCIWKKCTFCDYYDDVSNNPYEINKNILNKVTGKTGVLDVINSGSAMELDCDTIKLLQEIIISKNINTLWFEAHWLYHNKLNDFADNFKNIDVKFRTGIETFDVPLRNSWKKGIPNDIDACYVSKFFKGVCLLIGVENQTKEIIINDISKAISNFEYVSINVFCENTTVIKCDKYLIKWFKDEVYETLKDNPKVEILIYNTDLGVG